MTPVWTVIRMVPAADLNQTSFEHAVEMLGDVPRRLVCGSGGAETARRVVEHFGLFVFIEVVPPELLRTPYCWALIGDFSSVVVEMLA